MKDFTRLSGNELHRFLSQNNLLFLGFRSQDRALAALLRLLPAARKIIQLSPVDELRACVARMISKHNRDDVITRATEHFRELEREYRQRDCVLWWDSAETVASALKAAAQPLNVADNRLPGPDTSQV